MSCVLGELVKMAGFYWSIWLIFVGQNGWNLLVKLAFGEDSGGGCWVFRGNVLLSCEN